MNALATLILGELRRKKAQSLLTALLLLLSTWLSATSIILINQSENRFQNLFDKANAPHEMVVLDTGRHDPQSLFHWWQSRSEVETSSLLPYKTINKVSFGDEVISNLYVYMIKTPVEVQTVDKLQFVQGGQTAVPEPGTVWLPSSLAYGSGIGIGDTLTFESGNKRFELKTAAIVIDIPFGAPFSTTARIWMNPQDYQEEVGELAGDDRYLFGIRYQDHHQSTALWNELAAEWGTPYLESKISYEEIASFYLVMNKMIGFILMVLGIIMLAIALVTIGFTISDAILAQYRKIGILKAMGMTSAGTTGIYVLQYTFLALLGIVPGVLLSGVTSDRIVDLTLAHLKSGQNGFDGGDLMVLFIVGTGILLLTSGCAYAFAKRTAFIMPAQAIRYGMSEKESAKRGKSANAAGTWPRFDKYPFFVAIGLRHLKQNRKGSALMAGIALTSSAAITLGFVLVSSLLAIHQSAGKWGYDNADISVAVVNEASFSKAAFNADLDKDERIEAYGWLSAATGVMPSGEPGSVSVSILDGSYDELGFETLRGRNPGNRNEIAIGIKIAETHGLHVGDRMEMYIGGQKVSLIVSGIYQAIANMSVSARITSDALPNSASGDAGITDVAAFIQLEKGVSADAVAEELQALHPSGLTVATQKSLLDSVFKEAVNSLLLPMFFVGLLFLGVSAIIVYSICRIGIRSMLKTYGIYKTIGLTSRSIRLSISFGIAMLSAAGAVIGTISGIWLLTSLLELVLRDYGISELPLILQWPGIIAFGSLSVLPAFAGSWLSTRILVYSSPRELVVE